MENRKFVMYILLAFLAGGFFIISSPVYAYHIATHEYLTKTAIDEYNQQASSHAISNDLAQYIIDGARREDDPPRWLNHFYDPTDNSGLHRNGAIDPGYYLGSWSSSVVWAQSDAKQTELAYSPTIATILSSIANKKIEKFLPTSDFTWDEALRYWIQGDKEMAMFSLGHILHLIEDITVPAHTRNDPHSGGDSYEAWAEEHAPHISVSDIPTPPSFSDIGAYFTNLATFTNADFYSDDTIGIQSGYQLPQIQEIVREASYAYGLHTDNAGRKYRLVIEKTPSALISNTKEFVLSTKNKNGGDVVLKDYWDILAPKSISYSAGVINLFFKEAEAHSNDPAFQTSTHKSFIGRVLDATKNVFSSLFGKSKPDVSVPLAPDNNGGNMPSQSLQNNGDNTPIPKPDTGEQTPPQQIPDTTDNNPIVPLTVARVIDGDTIVLNNGDIIRYTGINAPEMNPEECWAKEAKQLNEKLVLGKTVHLSKEGQDQDTDNYGRLVRYVWVGDTLINKALIEQGAARAFNFGHPHAREQEFVSAQTTAKTNQDGLWSNACNKKSTSKQEKKKDETPSETTAASYTACSFTTTMEPSHAPVIINEVAWMGSTDSASNEWIELYNPTSQTINLAGWTLADKDEQISVVFGNDDIPGTIGVHDYYLLERTDDDSVPNIVADAIYTGTLSNTNEGLRLFNSHCQLIDEVFAEPQWPAGNSAARRTMERDATTLTWHVSSQANGTPKAANTPPPSSGGGGSESNTEDDSGGSGTTGTGTPPTDANIVINEIMYDAQGADSGHEWVEIVNHDTDAVDLSAWTFYEQDTHHSLTLVQGSSTLALNDYAIIADDADQFLQDYPTFSGTLFDSTFSLNNTGESLSLYNDTLEIDAYTYSNQTGGAGNSNTIGIIGDIWQETTPTPGADNQTTQTSQGNATIPDHILISELQVGGTNPDDEFIELYNPTDHAISVNGYSIHYISGKATSTQNESKKNFPDTTIPSHRFFLLAQTGGAFAGQADMTYSFSLSGNSTGATIVLTASTSPLLSINDPSTLDALSYGTPALTTSALIPLPSTNTSAERNAINNNICVSSQNESEFLGNACDTDVGDDFTTRQNPTPQNLASLPEPRTAPDTPQNVSASFDTNTVRGTVSFENNASTSTYYSIINADTDMLYATTTASSTSWRVMKVGRTIPLNISLCDNEGLCSTPATSNITAPSFFSSLSIYPQNISASSTITTDTPFAVEAYYSNYPFLPDLFGQGEKWTKTFFYLNDEAQTDAHIYSNDPADISHLLPITYNTCAGSLSENSSLLLPSSSGYCNTSGGAYNGAMSYSLLEDNHFSITAFPARQSSYDTSAIYNNYVTLAFYNTESLMPSNGTVPYFGLIATDATHYHLGTEPTHQPPELIGDVDVLFNQSNSILTISWPTATDPDTLDSAITYAVQFSTNSDWINVGTTPHTTTSTSPGDTISMSVKAIDETGLESGIIGPADWSYPEKTYVFIQNEHNGNSTEWGSLNGNGVATLLAQSITPTKALTFDTAETLITHHHGDDTGTLRLSFYPDNAGRPDIAHPITSAQTNVWRADEKNVTFSFSSPVTLDASTTYWAVFDVTGYNSGNGWTENTWTTAISDANPYDGGMVADMQTQSGAIAEFHPQNTQDIYLKLSTSP